jgi:hypothetical protein
MQEKTRWRDIARRAVENYLREHRFPRFALGLLLILTGFVGFFISYLLLRAGVDHMWIRYPVAVMGAYGIFLLLLRGWAEIERARFDANVVKMPDAAENERDHDEEDRWESKETSWLDWLDLPADFGDGEGCLPLLLIGVAIGLIAIVCVALFNAPALLAEVFADVFLLSIIYRKLRIAAREHWLGTAIRKTWRMALMTALLLMVGGGCLEMLAPGSRSIGPAIAYLINGNPSH